MDKERVRKDCMSGSPTDSREKVLFGSFHHLFSEKTL